MKRMRVKEKNNKENHSILNSIYDILAQHKKITRCKVPAHMAIKGNEEIQEAAKEAIDMPGIIKTRLCYTD